MPGKYHKKIKKVNFFKNNFSIDINQLVTLSLVLLMIIILIVFGLWGYQIYLDKNNANLNTEIEYLQSQRNLDLEVNFSNLKKGIEDFKKILEVHIYPSQIFKILEELTIPQVKFLNFNADLTKSKLILETEAVDYNTLAEQIVVFEEDWRIKNVEISEVKLDISGNVNSNLEIEIDTAFLRSVQ